MRIRWLLLGVLAVGIAAPRPALAASPPLPTAAQVLAGYGDDAQRWVALNQLWSTLSQAKTLQHDPAVFDRTTEYFRAMGVLTQKYSRKNNRSAAFWTRCDALRSDPSFQKNVLARYGLTAVAEPPSSAGGRGAPVSGNPGLFVPVTLVLMAVAPALITFVRGRRAPGEPVPPGQPADIPPPPESLRQVRVFGRRFPVQISSGMIEEGAATKADAFPIRSTDGTLGEMWFEGGLARFNASPGQLVSYVAARNRKGNYHFLLVYSHLAREMHTFENIARGTKPPFFLPWLGATLIGTIGFSAFVQPYVAFAVRETGLAADAGMATRLILLGGTFVTSATLAIVPAWLTYSTAKARNAQRFMAGYRVSYQTYFDQITPALTRHFKPRV